MKAFLIFPHQLFEEALVLPRDQTFYLIESDLFFKQYNFHQQKLLFHRASLCYFADLLTQHGFQVVYIEANDPKSDIIELLSSLQNDGLTELSYFDTHDYLLERRIHRICRVPKNRIPSPNFLNQDTQVLGNKKTYFQTAFYIQQRKNLQILIDEQQNPLGGQWSFDAENRKKIPKNTYIPQPFPNPSTNPYIQEAIQYIQTHFSINQGTLEKPFLNAYYPCTHAEAQNALELFIQERLSLFGIYEDAILAQESTLFHSVLSPLINVGLLNPAKIISQIAQAQAPLNSLEGFIRQIIGWREFVQLLYQKIGTQQRTSNYWHFTHEMPEAFYSASTGIEPVDMTIRKLLKTGYNHHIERLMVLGNFMLLCEIKPDAVYQWFMEMYIDAYDWVMVPNVYGMSQFSDGGMMTTKPYICGSNYILKMSDYKKGPWQAIWDGLFWRFLDKQRATFSKNPRWAMLISTWDKMPHEKKESHLQQAESYLFTLFPEASSEDSNKKKN
ncbi:cryptochrome/photolyase family protein [Aquirufa nivalisilvae]|uniref:cryptochrome/photolyase family protein n=1 Tax=Aquirufa nivalisilvae TaxID=2516557 RepID=UPI0022A9106C|nr:cryptochrome/photolyase family protein [Aquirufa nivalisilvae]MCZ2479165.1 cryptochrome/photolyase family protein [Aquirufa nivalisilvae]